MNSKEILLEQAHSNLLNGNRMKQLQLKNSMSIGKKDCRNLSKVIFRSIPDNSARLNALLAGDIDLADGINPSDGAAIEGNADLTIV